LTLIYHAFLHAVKIAFKVLLTESHIRLYRPPFFLHPRVMALHILTLLPSHCLLWENYQLPAERLVTLGNADTSTRFHIVVSPESVHNTTSFLPLLALILTERPRSKIFDIWLDNLSKAFYISVFFRH